MNRTGLVLLALLLVLGAVFAWPDADAAGPVEPGREQPSAENVSGSETDAQPARVQRPETDGSPADRTELEPQASTPDAVRTGKRVRVVDGETGERIANAIVWFLSPRALAKREIQAVRHGSEGADPVTAMREHGLRLFADANGETRLPEFEGDSRAIVGASESPDAVRVGWVSIATDTRDPVVIETGPRRDVTVAVRDVAGRPASDVPLRLVLLRNGYWSTAWRGTTADGGRAVITDVVQRLRAADRNAPLATIEALVHVDAPLGERPKARVDATALPDRPVDLTLPPTGRVKVIAEHPDASRFLFAQAFLSEIGLPTAEDDLARRAVEQMALREAVFPLVGLGLKLRVAVRVSGANEDKVVEVDGPTAPDQELVVRVSLVETETVLVAQLETEGGEPFAEREVEVFSRAESGHNTTTGYFSVNSDTDGRVFITLTDDLGLEAKRQLRLRSESDVLVVEPTLPRPLHAGENDLGRLTLREPPLLVAGHVVDSRGDPIAGAQVTVESKAIFDAALPNGFYWDDVDGANPKSADDGTFTARGLAPSDDLKVTAAVDGYLDARPLEIPRGTVDVALRLERAGGLEGEVLVPRFSTRAHLEIRVRHRATGVEEKENSNGGAFALESLRPGSVDVGVYLFGLREPIVELPGITITSGETTELDPIDLREELRILRFRVVDENGALVRDAQALMLPNGEIGGASARIGGVRTTDGRGEFIATDAYVDLFVFASGRRSQLVAAPRDGHDIVLPPALELRLRVPSEAMPAAASRLRVTLGRTDGRFERFSRYVLRGRNGVHSTSGALPWDARLKATVDASGIATLLLPEPGTYAAQWALIENTDDGTTSTGLGDVAPSQIVVRDQLAPQSIAVELTKAIVDAAAEGR